MRTYIPVMLLVATVAFSIVVVGCTDETIVQNNPPFDDPPSGANGFLGKNSDGEIPVCGNCHVGQQTRWAGTDHANAWETLQNSGHSAPHCENCHTVGPNGNPEDDGGWAGANDARYHDVQCESCHGPGLMHVNIPDASQPQASIAIFGPDSTYINCAECHQGTHHPFVEEWAQSGHAEPVSYPAGREECIACHTGQGALDAWGIDNSYKEMDDPLGTHVGIVCAVCHDPHSNRHEGQLRFAIDAPSEIDNLCIKCHHKRASPDLEASVLRGPHSPEGPLLLGEAGWWPPNFDQGKLMTSHGPAGNDKMCATCHVSSYEVTDSESGGFVFAATGHLFKAIPCTDEQGIPTPEDCDIAERSFEACEDCHGAGVAQGLYNAINIETDMRVAEIDDLLTMVPDGELDNSDGVFTTADGAWFNARLAESTGSPIHNPFLVRNLLLASIAALEDEYGVSATTSLQPALREFRQTH